MDWKVHLNGVGSIVTNLQALETVLRAFLVERYGHCAKFPNMGDDTACRSYLTAYVSLGELLDDYHRDLLQSQPNHVEVLCEKNTIYHMVLRVTKEFQIPTSSGRGS